MAGGSFYVRQCSPEGGYFCRECPFKGFGKISNLANIFRPDAIIIGGGICVQGDNFIDHLQKIVGKEIFAGDLEPAGPVVISKLGNRTGMLGTAELLMGNL